MEKKMIRIALAGNPNTGKTTLFNALTGSNQFVGNWPGVTVEKKEGKLRGRDDVIVTDLPGIYSLSPYTLEEVVARNYLIDERPDAILNLVDGTNIERNLYLTTQMTEIGIPVVVAINMMDVVRKRGDKINISELSQRLGCEVIEISALKETGLDEAVEAAIYAAKNTKTVPMHSFSGSVEHVIAHIEEAAVHSLPEEQQRWYAVKIFERDQKVMKKLKLDSDKLSHIENDIKAVEAELDDDSEGIIANERYNYISSIIEKCYKRKNAGKPSTSDKIDSIVTNRFLGLPIFAFVMFLVYYISMVTVGAWATDWTNDGVFGSGWHLLSIGSSAYGEAYEKYENAQNAVNGFLDIDFDAEDFDKTAAIEQIKSFSPSGENEIGKVTVTDEETLEDITLDVYYEHISSSENSVGMTFRDAALYFEYDNPDFVPPSPEDFGVWVPGVPVLMEGLLERANAPAWLSGIILDGIVAGVGAVLGFVPQILVLFLFLAFLEACGYMSRIAFVLDRIFRKFGLSGKSFIPMLIGTGCSVPGIMASRTIENENDRRMTIITTSFIPCGAKVPFIAMIAGAIFGGSALIATSAYFIGIAAIIVSGVILKKTRLFSGEDSPFVMELPMYHMPTFKNVMRSMWDNGWSFIKKAGTIILLSSVVLWFVSSFGFTAEGFRMLNDDELNKSMLAYVGNTVAWLFAPLGFGTWQSAVASLTGLIAKENIVATMGVLYNTSAGNAYSVLSSVFTPISAFSFLVFNLLCAPCFAAMGAIRREMHSAKWTAFAISYQCLFAYSIALMINQFGNAISGNTNTVGVIAAAVLLLGMLFMLFKPKRKSA